jgi:GT2 family glycosyltransferase
VEPGSGITRAVNIGIQNAKGDAIMPWLCADDHLDTRFLAAMARTLSDDKVDFAYGNWHAVDDGKVIKSRAPDERWRLKIAYFMPVILPNAFVFKRSVFQQVGLLEESLKYANDYDFLRRLLSSGLQGSYCPDAWYYFQVGGLSQAKHFECALEVTATAINHGSARLPTYVYFATRFTYTKLSFLLNACRKLARGFAARDSLR